MWTKPSEYLPAKDPDEPSESLVVAVMLTDGSLRAAWYYFPACQWMTMMDRAGPEELDGVEFWCYRPPKGGA